MTRTAALNAVYELAKTDERVVFVGSDLAPNTMADFRRDFPDRWFMAGISEQHVMGMAAGLALEGFIPFVNNISTFITRRCYEQIMIDVCSHNLPVRLLGNGGGLVYAPLGETHIGYDDLSLMRCLPNMNVCCPSDNDEMRELIGKSIDHPGPIYFRLAKDTDPIYTIADWNLKCPVLIITTGIMSQRLSGCPEIVGMCNILHTPIIKPLMSERILTAARGHKVIVTVEEGAVNGGLGTAVLECLSDHGVQIPVLRLGVPDAFAPHYGEQDDLLETYGLIPQSIYQRIKAFYDEATR